MERNLEIEENRMLEIKKDETDLKKLESLKNTLENFIEINEKYKNSFFWTPPRKAADRRAAEFLKEFKFIYEGDEIEVSMEVSMSCKNVYFYKNFKENGTKKDIRLIKKILKNIDKTINNLNKNN